MTGEKVQRLWNAARRNQLWPIKSEGCVWMWVFLYDRQFFKASQESNMSQCFPCTAMLSHLPFLTSDKDMPCTGHSRDQYPKWGSGTYGCCLIYIQTTNISSLHRMPPLLLRLTPPYELWLPSNPLSKCNNIHLFPFPCTPISTLLSLIVFRVNCGFCVQLKMSVCHWSCSIVCGVLLRLCLNALDLALKGGILSGSFWSKTALPANSWLSTSTSRLWRWVTYPDPKNTF